MRVLIPLPASGLQNLASSAEKTPCGREDPVQKLPRPHQCEKSKKDTNCLYLRYCIKLHLITVSGPSRISCGGCDSCPAPLVLAPMATVHTSICQKCRPAKKSWTDSRWQCSCWASGEDPPLEMGNRSSI